MKSELKVFSGNGNPALAQAICDYLHLPMGQWRLTRFKDGEIYCQILENVRANYQGVTLVSVTQKIEPVQDYDQIVLLMEGEVLAAGTHEALLETCPEYAQIYESQRSTSHYESVQA